METMADIRPAVAGGHDCDALLAEFGTWLTQQRGLSPVSVRCYVTQARLFLAAGSAAPDETVRELDAVPGHQVRDRLLPGPQSVGRRRRW